MASNESELQVPSDLETSTTVTVSDSTVTPELKSVGILPFTDLSLDSENAYFAAGIHLEIISQLGKIADLRVIPRTSIMKYQNTNLTISEIARELNVDAIMEGSVRFANNQVRINLQLLSATDENNILARDYNFEFENIFAIQSEVAQELANAMQASLLPEELARIERPASQSTEAYNT